MRTLLFSLTLLAACSTPPETLCLDTLTAKCQKFLDCDPEGFATSFGDGAAVAQCVSDVSQLADSDADPDTASCSAQDAAGSIDSDALESCLAVLPEASCEDFLQNRVEECR